MEHTLRPNRETYTSWASPVAQLVKKKTDTPTPDLPMQETQEPRIRSLGWEDPLEREMETCSSILVWKIPWTEEPGRLQSLESQRVGHEWGCTHAGGLGNTQIHT